MKKATFRALMVIVVVGVFLVGSWYGRREPATPAGFAAGTIVHHAEAMPAHSAHDADTPDIVRVADASAQPVHVHAGLAAPGPNAGSRSPGSVTISREKQQLIGIRVSPVEKASVTHVLRLFGRVVPDEARVYRLNAGIDGYIREVSAATTGSQVKTDQPLATFSAPDSIAAIQAYVLALNAVDRLKQGGGDISTQIDPVTGSPTNTNYLQRLEKLHNLGMSALQIDEIRRTRQVPQSIGILAPADGFVLARSVSPGLKFDRGAEWYRIADLSRVWILADVFPREAQYLRPGVRAKVSLPDEPNALAARVAEVLPQFDAATRTLKVRLEADNPGYALRPDMFVDVDLPISLPSALAVPVDAVLDSGLRKTVFVERGEGSFEPRQVETGWRFGDRIAIVKGLAPGERIAVSGTFLLDSESRMQGEAAPIDGTPVRANAAHGADDHAAHDHGSHGHSGH